MPAQERGERLLVAGPEASLGCSLGQFLAPPAQAVEPTSAGGPTFDRACHGGDERRALGELLPILGPEVLDDAPADLLAELVQPNEKVVVRQFLDVCGHRSPPNPRCRGARR